MALGLARQGFDLDLAEGNYREDGLAVLLRETHSQIELKSDHLAKETGNVFVEYETKNGGPRPKPSGISVTTAGWWAFNIVGLRRIVLIETAALKALARQAVRTGKVVWAGDQNRFHGALVPISWLVNPPPEIPDQMSIFG